MNYDYIHYFSLTWSRSREPKPKFQYTGSSSGSGQKFQLLAAQAPAPQHCIRQPIREEVKLPSGCRQNRGHFHSFPLIWYISLFIDKKIKETLKNV
jgi:hypothetical protein